MAARSNYSELVTAAEKAVEAVKNPALRRLAFQKVLDDMLGATPTRGNEPKRRASADTARNAATRDSKAKKGGPQFYVEELANERFFKKPKTISQVRIELKNRGHHLPVTSLSGPLQKLCQRKVLRRQKTEDATKKGSFAYSEW